MSAKPTSSDVPKPSLGQYVFAEKLGSGTYASVYKAYRKTGLREVVAIKCVLKSSLNKASTENLLTEIELLKNLKHEHIVSLKDFLWDTSYIYLIMEFCSGGDMSKFIHFRRALPEHVVKRFLQQIASAMKYLWDNNIAHMDLKPQNILLTSSTSPELKLADFGFAKPLYDGDSLHVMRGSPLYMAPEIICKGQYDNRVDLWSIGVILYECLFGKAPFASKTYKELGQKIWDERPVEFAPGFNLSDSARDLMKRMLQRDPDKRITFEEFFAHSFIDMAHMPSKDSLKNAIDLASKAVAKDEAGNFKEAVRFYCESLEFFMPAIYYDKSHHRKEMIREQVRKYVDRAEVLKKKMKPQVTPPKTRSTSTQPKNTTAVKSTDIDSTTKVLPPRPPPPKPADVSANSHHPDSPVQLDDTSHNAIEESITSTCDSKELQTALLIIQRAIEEEKRENYTFCLASYEKGLGMILKILPNEPKSKRRDHLSSYVKRWMDKAEEIKSYLDVQTMKTADTSLLEDEEMNQSRCCIQ